MDEDKVKIPEVRPDPETGYVLTEKQLQILFALNPLKYDRDYEQVAGILGVSKGSVQNQMSRLKQRCPVVYKKFKKLRKKACLRNCLSLDYEYAGGDALIDKCYFSEDSNYINADAPFVGGFTANNGEFISFKIKEIF